MLDGFYLPSEEDITTCKGVVYLIAFYDESFYIGSTSQCFRKRYGTISLRDSHLVANSSIKRKLDGGVIYEVFLHQNKSMNDEDRFALEYLLIEQNIRSKRCLNLRTESENFGVRRQCSLKSPDGVVVEFESVKQARDFIGASNHSQISQVLNGRVLSVCGWTLPGTVGPVGSDIKKKPCVLIDPSGKRIEFESYGDASKIIGVSQNCISLLVLSKVTTLRGWTNSNKASRKYIPVKLISPNGTIREFASRLEASKSIGCCNQLVSNLCYGKAAHAKGWKLAESPRLRDGR